MWCTRKLDISSRFYTTENTLKSDANCIFQTFPAVGKKIFNRFFFRHTKWDVLASEPAVVDSHHQFNKHSGQTKRETL
ncbi:hypothetical protein SMSP1_00638 [Sedimentisphaera salicampi]|nr:hypothetical protein SMSP1_00638 [Sedimentisphaera salicampi]